MGGGALRGGPVVRAGLSWGKCYSISGSLSSRHKIINRVFIAELLCWVSLGLSARSQQRLMVPMCRGRRVCSVSEGGRRGQWVDGLAHRNVETTVMARLEQPPPPPRVFPCVSPQSSAWERSIVGHPVQPHSHVHRLKACKSFSVLVSLHPAGGFPDPVAYWFAPGARRDVQVCWVVETFSDVASAAFSSPQHCFALYRPDAKRA